MAFQNKEAMSGITLIVAAVIGLIILVVIVAMISGKLGSFGKGTDQSVSDSAQNFFNTCSDACKLFAKEIASDKTKFLCESMDPVIHPQVVPGSYSDIDVLSGKVCCCRDSPA